jgi:plastocyanin
MTTVIAALGLTLGVTAVGTAEPPRPRTHTVVVENMRFEPKVLAVAPGDTVVWLNKDLVAHTATSRAGGFDSKVIPASASWTYTARKKGAFAYLCTLHPAMKGTLRVK